MVRDPIFANTHLLYIRTPGSMGINDAADPNNHVFKVLTPMPLGLAHDLDQQTKRKSTKSSRKRKLSKVDAAAKLKKPVHSKIRQLSTALNNVQKENKKYEISKKAKDEQLRLKKEKVVKDIVKAYNIGLKHATGLEFSNRNPELIADTRRNFIVVYDGILVHPGFVASDILHESSHAQRNAELANAGVDRSVLGFSAEEIWKTIIEIEGYQLEIDFATKTGITEKEKKGAEKLRNDYLSDLQRITNKQTRKKIEQGGLDNFRAQFIRKQRKLQQ